MFVFTTLLLLVLASALMVALRLSRSSASYSWLVATFGALLAWVSIFIWPLNLPQHFSPTIWTPTGLFSASPQFMADLYGWLYGLSLAALAVAVLLTSPVRASIEVNPAAWAGTLAISILGLVAILSDNILTLVIAWTAIDIAEFFNTLRASNSPQLSERTVIAFAIRAAGTGFALWANVLSSAAGQVLVFDKVSGPAGLYLLLAAGLRLGVLPLHLTFRSEPVLRRGFGTTLRLTTAATSLILVTRLASSTLDSVSMPILFIFIVIAALYSAFKWLFAPDELSGRPYWIIGMSSLSLAAALRGSPEGSAAWGVAMLLFGGISFLYSARQLWFSRFLAGLGIILLALPFTLTASGWMGTFPFPALFWPLFLLAHLMLVIGYIRHLFHSGETAYSDLPNWARSAYPVGIGILALTAIVAGIWGWPGAMQFGSWVVAVILLAVTILIIFAAWRFQRFSPSNLSFPVATSFSRFGNIFEFTAWLVWSIYRTAGQLFNYTASLLEGDGGLLWTLASACSAADHFSRINMPDLILWMIAILLAVTSAGLLVSRDWRWSLGLLALQYFAGFWLVLAHWPLTMAAAKLVAGWMAAAALGMTHLNLQDDVAAENSWPEGRLFRIFATGLVILGISTAANSLGSWLPNAALALRWGGLVLIGMGLLHLGMTIQPLRVVLGLLTTLLGFEILYSTVENSILVAGLLALVTLGLALAGSYLLILQDGEKIV